MYSLSSVHISTQPLFTLKIFPLPREIYVPHLLEPSLLLHHSQSVYGSMVILHLTANVYLQLGTCYVSILGLGYLTWENIFFYFHPFAYKFLDVIFSNS